MYMYCKILGLGSKKAVLTANLQQQLAAGSL